MLRTTALALLGASLTACAGSGTEPSNRKAVALHVTPKGYDGEVVHAVAGIDLSFIAVRISADSIRLGAASNLQWSTSNAQTATVSSAGVVHSVAAGSVNITALSQEGTRVVQGTITLEVVQFGSSAALPD